MVKLSSELVRNLGWTTEDGRKLDPDLLRPAFDESTGIVYGTWPEGDVSIVKRYENYRTRCARDFAVMVWPDPESWKLQDERLVSCLGSACCSNQAEADFPTAWRITQIQDGEILARRTTLSDESDEPFELSDEHIVYISPYPENAPHNSQAEDTAIAAIELFGRPYDPDMVVNPAFSKIYQQTAAPETMTSQVIDGLGIERPGILPEHSTIHHAKGWDVPFKNWPIS